MGAISASMVKELREKSSAGMMDCKEALTACDGDIEKAMDYLRKKGLSKAAKRSGRDQVVRAEPPEAAEPKPA